MGSHIARHGLPAIMTVCKVAGMMGRRRQASLALQFELPEPTAGGGERPGMTMAIAQNQLILDLPHEPQFGENDFIESGSNSAALDLIRSWPRWPHWGAVVTGPAGAGKSHLAHVWQCASKALMVRARDLSDGDVKAFRAHGALLVEDLHDGIVSETLLFHLLNTARQDGLSVLMTSRIAPGDLAISLPDLRSRLRALPIAAISDPDEMLLRALMVKLFSDRQIRVEPKTVNYLINRMDRSMDAAQRVVERIDGMALQLRRPVTVPLAQAALESLGQGEGRSLSGPAAC